jgi:hypothetical protein
VPVARMNSGGGLLVIGAIGALAITIFATSRK